MYVYSNSIDENAYSHMLLYMLVFEYSTTYVSNQLNERLKSGFPRIRDARWMGFANVCLFADKIAKYIARRRHIYAVFDTRYFI